MLRSRNHFLTSPHSVRTVQEVFDDYVKKMERYTIEYLAVVEEKHKDGTPHIHLVGKTSKQPNVVFSEIDKIFGKHPNVQIVRDQKKTLSYVNKYGTPVTYNNVPMQTLIENVSGNIGISTLVATELLEDPEVDIMTNHPGFYLMHRRRVLEFKEDLRHRRKLESLPYGTKMEWYWGPTGTGKTHKAREEHPDYYDKGCNKWWDGYIDQEVVLLEELSKKYGEFIGYFLKRWADRFPFTAEVKNGSTGKIRPRLIIVTSNWHPKDVFQDEEDLYPILRRFNVTHFTKKYVRTIEECEK